MVPDDGSMCGTIPSSLFTSIKSIHGFSNMNDHLKSRSTSVSIDASISPTYLSYYFDKLINSSLNHGDTCIVLNRGPNADNESTNGIGVR